MEQINQCTPGELEQIMEQYGNMVYRLAYAQIRNRSDADDIYQEVFLRYFRKRPRFQSEEHRKAWLLRVTINRARSFMKSAWFRHTVPLEAGFAMTEPETAQLDDALSALKPDERRLLHLYYYEELSVQQIAALLNRKESTVRTQLTRARLHLKKIMKGEDESEYCFSKTQS